jgi:hypothetical protein
MLKPRIVPVASLIGFPDLALAAGGAGSPPPRSQPIDIPGRGAYNSREVAGRDIDGQTNPPPAYRDSPGEPGRQGRSNAYPDFAPTSYKSSQRAENDRINSNSKAPPGWT